MPAPPSSPAAHPRLDALPSRFLPGGLRVAEARGAVARLRGLAGLAELPGDRALHLARCRSVHTFGMRSALDLIWLDADGAPVRVDRDVPPRRLRLCPRARSVLECRAGTAGRFLAAAPTPGPRPAPPRSRPR
jgi:hypothetical protein